MISFYQKVFYHLYKLAIKSGEDAVPLSSAVPAITFLLFCNLMVIGLSFDLVGINIFTTWIDRGNPTNSIIVIGVTMLISNYIYFISGDRYKKLLKEYSDKPIEERKRGARITLLYALVSIVLIFILAPLRIKMM